METNEYMFNEIMQRNENFSETSVALTLDKMYKYCKNIELLLNDSYQPYYRVKTDDLKKMNLEMSELLELNESGWVLNENKDFIEYFFNFKL